MWYHYFMPAQKTKNKTKAAVRPRIDPDRWWRIVYAAAAVREKPESYLAALIDRALPPAFRGGATK
jgi:hypothetical protein